MDYKLNDKIIMKKPHPCGENLWIITRLGADIKIKCTKCNHSVMIDRLSLNKRIKEVIEGDSV